MTTTEQKLDEAVTNLLNVFRLLGDYDLGMSDAQAKVVDPIYVKANRAFEEWKAERSQRASMKVLR